MNYPDLIKLPSKELRQILKELKIAGCLQCNKASMAQAIIRRTQLRERWKKLTMSNDESKTTGYWSLGMDQLHRLICRDHDNKAYEEWRRRYGHDYPVYAIINGEESKYSV